MLRFVKGSLGLTLVVLSFIISTLASIALFASSFFAASAYESVGSGASALWGLVVLGSIAIIIIMGLVFTVGVILAIVEYVRKKDADTVR